MYKTLYEQTRQEFANALREDVVFPLLSYVHQVAHIAAQEGGQHGNV